MLSRTLLCLAVFSASTPLLADTVWLKNGDRLSGKIKLFDGGKLLIQTDYAGAIPVDWKQVKTLESDQQLLVKQDAYTGEKAKSLQAGEDGQVILANRRRRQLLEPCPGIEPHIVCRDHDVVGVEQQSAAGSTGELGQELRLGKGRMRERQIAGRVLDQNLSPEPLLQPVDIALNDLERLLGVGYRQQIVEIATVRPAP